MKKRSIVFLVVVLVLILVVTVACGRVGTESTGGASGGGETTTSSGGDTGSTDSGGASVTQRSDLENFVIDPAQIPQEKLDTVLQVGCTIRDLGNPYLKSVTDGSAMFCDYLDSIGQKYELTILAHDGNSDKQVSDVTAFATKAQGNGIIYIDGNDAPTMVPLMEACQSQGTYCGFVWLMPPGHVPWEETTYILSMTPEQEQASFHVGEAIAKAMGEEGKILMVGGDLVSDTALFRYNGAKAALDQYSGIDQVEYDVCDWLSNKAQTIVETWLTKHPDVAGIWAAFDDGGLAAMQALDNVGLKGKVPIGGFDGTENFAREIAAGNATATVSANGYMQGGYILSIQYAVWTGLLTADEIPNEYRWFMTEGVVVTPDNVDKFIDDMFDNKPKLDFSKPWEYWIGPAPN